MSSTKAVQKLRFLQDLSMLGIFFNRYSGNAHLNPYFYMNFPKGCLALHTNGRCRFSLSKINVSNTCPLLIVQLVTRFNYFNPTYCNHPDSKSCFQETTTSRRLTLSSLKACTEYDFEITPWIDDFMSEDDEEQEVQHKLNDFF